MKYTLLAICLYDGLIKIRNNQLGTSEWVEIAFLERFGQYVEGY